jgi:hypothetical protein
MALERMYQGICRLYHSNYANLTTISLLHPIDQQEYRLSTAVNSSRQSPVSADKVRQL